VDWDNDGKKDLIAGDTEGNVTLFLNVGTKEKPELAKGKAVEADGKPIKSGSHPLAGTYSKLHMADWDGDGLRDLLIGHSYTIIMYKNVGTESAPRFQSPTLIKAPEESNPHTPVRDWDGDGKPDANFPLRPSPYVVDWDGDGKKDLLVGCESPRVIFYRNVGSDTKPKLAKGEELKLTGSGFGSGYRCRIDVTDWNNDGKKDLLVGNRCRGEKPSSGGNIWLFLGE
jgi:hypothetical protein